MPSATLSLLGAVLVATGQADHRVHVEIEERITIMPSGSGLRQ